MEQRREDQAGRCPICLAGPAVHVDHDHETGAVRGLVCFQCNAALGQLRSPFVIRRAAAYLEGTLASPRRVATGVFALLPHTAIREALAPTADA
ncbi:MAG TPA: endonuclease VII domain-containing protein [Actinomycetes bacterium]|nr:endonuclease VII domain-containing protein [Actinomycetes bacterium]